MESAIFSNQVSLKTGEMNFLMNILNKSQVRSRREFWILFCELLKEAYFEQ